MFNSTYETVQIFVVLIVGLLAVHLLFLRTQNRVSVFIPVAAGLLLFSFWGNRLDDPRSSSDSISITLSAEMGNESNSAEAETPEFAPDTNADTETEPTPRIEDTRFGKMLVLPLSAEALNEYLGTDGAAALDNISGVLPPELRRAYALVPIAGTVGDALPGLKALGKAVTDLANQARRSAAEPTADTTPAWLESPSEDQIVLTAFDEPGLAPAVVLQKKVTDQVLQDARTKLSRSFELPETWTLRREVVLSENAVRQCLVEHYQETIPIRAGEESAAMQSTSALIQIPDSVRQQAVDRLRESVQHQRTWTVGAIAICLGLVVMLTAGLVQLAGSPGRVKKLVGIPVLLVILLPSLTSSMILIRDIARHESSPLPEALDLPSAVIDVIDTEKPTDVPQAEASSEDLAAN